MINISNPIVGTYKDFKKSGYQWGELMWQRGYISRNVTHFEERPVYKVVSGKRKGQFFFLFPSFISTRYCYRVYLIR